MAVPSNYKTIAKLHRRGGPGRQLLDGRCQCQSCKAVRRDERRKRAEKRKAIPLLDRRADAAEKLLEKWQRSLATAATQVRKYSKRVRYYQRKRIESLERQISGRASPSSRLIELPE